MSATCPLSTGSLAVGVSAPTVARSRAGRAGWALVLVLAASFIQGCWSYIPDCTRARRGVTGLLLSIDEPRIAVGETIAYQSDVRINGWNGIGPLPGNGVPEEVDVLLWQTPLGRLDAGEGPYWGDYRYIAIEPEADTFRFRGQLEAVGAGRVLVWVGKFDDGIASAPVEIEIVPVVGDAGALEGSEARP